MTENGAIVKFSEDDAINQLAGIVYAGLIMQMAGEGRLV